MGSYTPWLPHLDHHAMLSIILRCTLLITLGPQSPLRIKTISFAFLITDLEMSDLDFELGHLSNPRPARLEGYPSLAHFIARDGEAAIFRRYAGLSARNLLYLQSQLYELEE